MPQGPLALGAVYLKGGLTVKGSTTLTGNLTTAGGITASGNQAVTGNSTVGGNQTIAGNASVAGFLDGSIAVGLAAVGTNRGTALALTKQVNLVATAASSAVGVVLPPAATVGVGGHVDVYNDGPANSFHVYGAGSDTVDGVAGSTGVALTNAFWSRYVVTAAGTYVSYRSAITRSA
jgi:hypothetical protein